MNIDRRLVDVPSPGGPDGHSGYPAEIAKHDTREAMMAAAEEGGAIITEFSDEWWIEPNLWQEVCDYNDENKLWGINYLDRFTHQGNTHECTCHSLRACCESSRNRQRRIATDGPVAGKRLEISAKSGSVWYSPISVYAEANPRQWGGASVRQVLRIAAERGLLPDKIQPKEYGFKHTLHGTCGKGGVNQSNGPWVPVSKFPEGWRDTAKDHRPLEYIFPATWEQHVCLLLNGLMVGVGRQGHAVPHGAWNNKERVAPYVDSYDRVLFDSISRIKSTIGGSFAVVSFTTPDDWDKPAG